MKSTSRATIPQPYEASAIARVWPWAVGVALIALAAHSPAIRNGFTYWDDTPYVGNNPQLRSLDGLKQIWTTRESPQYYPLTFTTYWLEYQLWGEAPAGYHAVNVALHAVNAGLVVLLLASFGMSGASAAAVGLLFAVAPVQVMSVAWLAERKNLLSTCFGLLALISFGRYFRGLGWKYYILGVLAFIAAVLSKSAWLVLPAIVLAAAVWIQRAPFWSAVIRVLPLLPIVALSAYVTTAVEQQYVDAEIPPLMERLLIAPGALFMQAAKALVPLALSPFYAKWSVDARDWLAWGPLLVLSALAMIFLWKRRSIPPVTRWGLLTFVVFLLPAVGFVPFGNLALTWYSDHLSYYAVIGLYAAVVEVAGRTLARLGPAPQRLVGGLAIAGVAVAFTVLTLRQIPVWRDALSLWQRAVDSQPTLWAAYHGRAYALIGRREHDRAIADLRKALELNPRQARIRADLGALLTKLGRYDEAVIELRRALEDEPRLAEAHLHLGVCAMHNDDGEEAARQYQAALEISPGYDTAASNLASLLPLMGRQDEVEPMLTRALEHNPNSVALLKSLGVVHDAQGRPADAEKLYGRAVQLDPSDFEAAYGLGVAAARQRKFDEAIRSYERAIALKPDHPKIWNNLGCAYIDSQRPAAAVPKLRKAVEIDPDDGPAWSNLGLALHATAENAESIRCLQRAIEINPSYARAHDVLASVLIAEKRYAEAVTQLTHALNVVQQPAKLGLANALCRLLANCPDPAVRNPQMALKLAEQIVAAAGDKSAEALDTLGMAQAATGAYEPAAASAERAMQLLESQGRKGDMAAIAARRDLYRAGKPYVQESGARGQEN